MNGYWRKADIGSYAAQVQHICRSNQKFITPETFDIGIFLSMNENTNKSKEAMEQSLHRKIMLGDITNTGKILNQFLESILPKSELDFNLVKIRIIELAITISRSAIECGFFDQSHFSRSFKSLEELTPNQYRRLIKV